MYYKLPPEIQPLSEDYQQMYLNAPLEITRRLLLKMTGNALAYGTLCNYDCAGVGPMGSRERVIKFGKVVYPRLEAVIWLANRPTSQRK